ncbi:MAG TPA: chemotaxis protein CheW [Bryobacteraceae bacterium]|nr:chemotaxis protein CheW [Bryobacteraceae bacterium]
MAAPSIIAPLRADEAPVETVFGDPPAYKSGKYLTFRVARREFAMSADPVRGILPLQEMVASRAQDSGTCGFARLGGRDFPVVNLAAKLSLPRELRGREPLIVVVEIQGRLAGFIAERISGVIDLRQKDFRSGAVRGRGRTRRVLDAEQILQADKICLSP